MLGLKKAGIELQGGLKYIYPPNVNHKDKITTPLYKTILKANTSINSTLDDYYAKIQKEALINSEKSKLLSIVFTKKKLIFYGKIISFSFLY